MFQEYRKQSHTCVLKRQKKNNCFVLMWDLTQDFHRLSRHASSPASGILCFCVCRCLTLDIVSESTFFSSHFQGFFVVLSLTGGHGDTIGDVSFHPVETIEGFRCHTVETVLQQGFVHLQMCSRIFYKIQNRNTSLICAFHSFKKHELLCARF